MFKEKFKGFIAGILTAAILLSMVAVFADTIEVTMSGIKVYWDGVEKKLTDANGEKVEPMIYNGTTYVPVRAMANLLGKKVSWNQQQQAVIVGDMPVAKSTPIEDMKEKINTGSWNVKTGKDANYTLKDKTYQCENIVTYFDNTIFMLNGEYTQLVGSLVYPYTTVGSNDTGKITFYSVENDGTETEIDSIELMQTEDPINFKINLKGVENLKIDDRYDEIKMFNAYFLGK